MEQDNDFILERYQREEHTENLERYCENLWDINFDDDEIYRQYYFQYKWKSSEVWVGKVHGAVCSMLHLNPYLIQCGSHSVLQLHYIVGVCTNLEYRGRGYMKAMLLAAMNAMCQQREPFTYLMPADPQIYIPYGFRYGYYAKRCRFVWKQDNTDNMEEDYQFTAYMELPVEDQRQVVEDANNMLGKKYTIYTQRTAEYMEDLQREMEACGGNLWVAYHQGKRMGYVAYGAQETEAEVYEAAGEGYTVEWLEQLMQHIWSSYTVSNTKNNQAQDRKISIDDLSCITGISGAIEPVLMMRILCFETWAQRLRSSQPITEVLYLTDAWIPENNGVWRLEINTDYCYVNRMPPETVYQRKITIEDIGEEWFQRQKIYLNELV